MKYQYKFGTGYEDVELDEEWVAVLKDFDRLERNNEGRQRYSTKLHYDAFEFVPEFMGKEDEGLSEMFDGTPAFEYAIEHLLPRHREILFRRASKGEMFKDIGKSYGVSASAIHHYYTKICIRFKRYYEEGLWINSSQNVSTKEAERVTSIPYGLTPAQVMAIRAYRCQLRPIHEIAELVGVPQNRVKRLLRDNPIRETRCPACGNSIPQVGYGVLQKFCDIKCYMSWFRQYGMDSSQEVQINQSRTHLTDHQQMVIDYYRLNYFTLTQMHIITGVSEQFISAYCYANPLPYTICLHCGKQVLPVKGKWPSKYCSVQCRNRYLEKRKKLRKRNGGHVRQRLYPTPEQLEYALVLRESCFTFQQIRSLAGISRMDTDDLFRFHKTVVQECRHCKKPFVTTEVQELYCSQKCQDKAKAKRKKKRKMEKNAISQPSNESHH